MIEQLDKDTILDGISELEAGIQNLYDVTVYQLDTEIDKLISETQNLYDVVNNLEVEE